MAEPIAPTGKPQAYQPQVTRTGNLRVTCGGPASGRHPKVFLTMVDDAAGNPHHVVCPYCSHVFEFDARLPRTDSH